MTYSGKKQPAPPRNPPLLKQKKSRIFLKLAVVLAGLFALLLILLLSLDLNAFRKPVTEGIYLATGTKIKLEHLEWEFSEGFQLQCKGVQILPDESGERRAATVATKELLINIELLPLLQMKVVIESITLIGPVLKFSIEPTLKPSTPPPSEKSSSDITPSPSMETKPPASFGLQNWLQNIRKVLRESKNFSLDEINLIAGQVILQDEGTGKEAILSAGARMEINREGNRVGFVIDDIELGMGNIRVQAQIRIDDIIPTNALVQTDIQIEPFEVSDLLPVLDWVPGGRGIINEQIRLKGKSRKIHLNFKTPLDAITDFESILKYANADLILKGQEVSLVQFGKTLSAQSFDVDLQWKDQQLAHKIVLDTLGGNFETEGKLFREKGSKSADDWTLDSHVILEEINMIELKNIMPNQVALFPNKGTLTGKIHVQGPVMRPEAMNGNVNLKVMNLEVKVKGTPVAVPVTEFKGEWANRRLVHDLKLKIFGGNLQIKGQLKMNKTSKGEWDPVIDSDVIPQSIQLASLRPLVNKNWFPKQGTLTGKVHLQGPVMRPETMKNKGNIQILNLEVKVKDTPVAVRVIDFKGEWANRRLVHDLKLKIFGGNLQVKGQLKMNKTRKGEWDPVIDSDVIPQSIRLASLRPLVQKDWFPKQGTLAGTVHVQGPVLRPGTMQGKGNLKVLNLEIKVKDTPVLIPVTEFEGEWANSRLVHDLKLKIFDGSLQVKGHLKMNRTRKGELDPVIDSRVFVKPVSLIRLKPLVAQNWFPGKGIIDGVVRVRGPILRPVTITAEGRLRVQNTAMPLAGGIINLAHLEGKGLWSENHLSHRITMKVFGGSVSVQGNLNFKKNNQGELDPVINSEVIPQSIRLADLRPLVQKNWFPKKGTLTGKIHVQGPVLRPETMQGKGNFKVLNLEVQVKDTPVAVPVIEFKGEWANSRLVHDLKLKIFGGNLQVKGQLKMNKTPKGEWDPVIDSDVIPQSIQLASLPPLVQKDLHPKQGTLYGKIHVRGPVNRISEIKLSGTLTGNRFYLKFKEKRIVFDKMVLSFKLIPQKSFLLSYSLSDLYIDNIRLKKSTGKMVFSKSNFELKQGKIWTKTGILLLNAAYKYETKDYHLDISGKGLRLENFRSGQTEGPLNLQGSFNGRVLSEKPERGLSGNFEFHSKNGSILKASNYLTKILTALNFKLPGDDTTLPFDSLGGNFTIKKGIVSTENFEIIGPSIRVQVSGEADLSDKTINAEVAAIPLQLTDEILDGVYKMIPFIEGKKSKGLIKTYFAVEGTFAEPKVHFLPGKTFWF